MQDTTITPVPCEHRCKGCRKVTPHRGSAYQGGTVEAGGFVVLQCSRCHGMTATRDGITWS